MDTINALLHNTNSLRNATILAGSRGLNNKISGVTVLEMSDLNKEGSSLLNLKQGEIVITSCNDIKENVEKQLQLIYALKQRKIAGILQMQFLLHSPMRILYQSMQNRLDIYDKKNKSNLKKMIVDCCLEYKMNLKEMAKAEFIHYNTVQYRMKKIEELLQINLKRPSDMDTLYTLALFMKMKEK